MKDIHVIEIDNNCFVQTLNDDLAQWNYGQVLCLKNIKSSENIRVDFSLNEKTGTCISVDVTKDNTNNMFVDIPKEILEGNRESQLSSYNGYAFVYEYNSYSGQTIKEIIMHITARPKPRNYNKQS